jgi:UDP-GlcNAc3NAcA epimerase
MQSSVPSIVTVVGARPQFIKAAIVSRAFQANRQVREILVHTGQHYDDGMSAVFFRELGLRRPDHMLDVRGGLHGESTGRMLGAIEQVLLQEKPDAVLVYGDTNSTLAGALAAAKLRIPVAHIEAGLRSFNRAMPEEVNRVLTDHISSRLFAPTAAAVENLEREGISGDHVIRTGDVMYDLALTMGPLAKKESSMLQDLELSPGAFVLATIHRAENTDDSDRLGVIIDALAEISQRVPVVLPLHPRTRSAAARLGRSLDGQRQLRVVEPLGYLDMLALEMAARLIVTDSGGVQKEAYFQRVPCVTIRDETEWVELVEAGWNTLAPPRSKATIVDAVYDALSRSASPYTPLYGAGDAGITIVKSMADWLI